MPVLQSFIRIKKKKLITELRCYPDVVRYVEPDQDIESLAANDSAKLAFDRLGEKYDCKFSKKYF